MILTLSHLDAMIPDNVEEGIIIKLDLFNQVKEKEVYFQI